MAPDFDKALALIDAAHAQDPNLITVSSPSPSSSSPSPPTSSPSPPPPPPPPPSSSSCAPPPPSPQTIPYELHYARKMTSYLHLHVQGSDRTETETDTSTSTTASIPSSPSPSPSPHLSLAVRAQHLRRWEIPRASYPAGKAAYFAWRTMLKKRQAEQAREICLSCGYADEDADRVAALVGKVGLLKKKTTKSEAEAEAEAEAKGDGKRETEKEDEVQILEDVACLVFLDDQFEAFERGHDEDKMLGILAKTWAKMGPRGRELALRIRMSERCRLLVERALAG